MFTNFNQQKRPRNGCSVPLVEAGMQQTRLTLLLCNESGGTATAIARVTDPRVVAEALQSAVSQKKEEARRAPDPFSRRKAEMEAELLLSA